MDKYRAARTSIDIAKKAIDAGALNNKGLNNETANSLCDFIEILADRLEKMDAPGDNY